MSGHNMEQDLSNRFQNTGSFRGVQRPAVTPLLESTLRTMGDRKIWGSEENVKSFSKGTYILLDVGALNDYRAIPFYQNPHRVLMFGWLAKSA